ncbi:hypothetical protein WA026_019359 [Henosepilachna vigintioctopunctata]|uniref:Uncharacterized protein n=1 Tax=Henosepilachna vigintioctopunctata TaxID=420089 RepID=A0AAW1UAQ2_9CUCU
MILLPQSTKFLGIYMDENLRWSEHVVNLNRKLSRACYSLGILANYSTTDVKRTVYLANFEPSSRFVIIAWGGGRANPNTPNKDGNSALHISTSHIETNKTKIFACILVQYNAKMDSQNNNNHTPLHIAVYEDKEYLVEVLLESGESTNIPDASGITPMHRASLDRFRYPRIFTRLCAYQIL